jgi:hypothetical protein
MQDFINSTVGNCDYRRVFLLKLHSYKCRIVIMAPVLCKYCDHEYFNTYITQYSRRKQLSKLRDVLGETFMIGKLKSQSRLSFRLYASSPPSKRAVANDKTGLQTKLLRIRKESDFNPRQEDFSPSVDWLRNDTLTVWTVLLVLTLRQVMYVRTYVKRNTEARACNHCCSGKATSIT